ncbi:MAG: hypothetical protein DI551_06650 [Micavibrio aeruginosavorus]|uniref:Uncharacterized protein n=1 Tax=Micavibrio aeruginosavorus TaxID=349221 RepID=A0A2W5PTC3_9BACT|nr:MAG: hypothetical protein DI551_06650 [Micavibrio aeruginosavorus]
MDTGNKNGAAPQTNPKADAFWNATSPFETCRPIKTHHNQMAKMAADLEEIGRHTGKIASVTYDQIEGLRAIEEGADGVRRMHDLTLRTSKTKKYLTAHYRRLDCSGGRCACDHVADLDTLTCQDAFNQTGMIKDEALNHIKGFFARKMLYKDRPQDSAADQPDPMVFEIF